MKTIVIKNLSTLTDVAAVYLINEHIKAVTNRHAEQERRFRIAAETYQVNVKIKESDMGDRISYIVTDRED